MRVGEVDALVAHSRKRGRGLRRHGKRAQSVWHKQNKIALILRARGSGLQENGAR